MAAVLRCRAFARTVRAVTISLRSLPLPALIEAPVRPALPASEYEDRINALMRSADRDWVLVYGDREHAANLAFLTNFDPRFEEALLVMGPRGKRALVLGNEGVGYTSQAIPELEFVLAQSFGLMGQTRATAPRLDLVLRALGMAAGDSVGMVGWKYLEPEEDDPQDADEPAYVPAYMLRHVRRIVGPDAAVTDVTRVLMHPTDGLKSHNSAAQIAQFEWAAMLASNAVQRVVRGARPGHSEAETAASLFAHTGAPYACHPMLTAAGPDEPLIGLRSPGDRLLRYGDGVSCAVGYWGSLCARAGLLRAEPDASFAANVALPYFNAIATWWQTLRIGVSGGAIHAAVHTTLDGVNWRPALNPGHLISIDEWTHTPIRENSSERLASGMALQCDIIPAPMPNGWGLNCEDGVALGDAQLRANLAANFPECWSRIQARRAWMRDGLGFSLADEVLPLSNAPGCLAPFWLAPDLICRVDA